MRDSEFLEKLVAINRITKVVKGGRRFGFAALVVVGNQKGSIGIGKGKSKKLPNLQSVICSKYHLKMAELFIMMFFPRVDLEKY